MQEINWGNFKGKFGGKEQAAFQWLCYLLFCDEFKIPLGISRYENHAGIETDPIEVDGEWLGWQAKFYETPISDHTNELKKSINKAKKLHPHLTQIRFYINRDFTYDTKTGKPSKVKKEIEDHGVALGVTVEWKISSFFESQFVTEKESVLIRYFFGGDDNVFKFIDSLSEHSKSNLRSIRSLIEFKDKKLKIDRSKVTTVISDAIKGVNLPIILSGNGGVGKTAIIKDLYGNNKNNCPIFVFKASEFDNLPNINALFRSYGNFGLTDFATAYTAEEDKCVVIDSAEKLSDIENQEIFQEFLDVLLQHKWRLIFTTRRSYLDVLQRLLVDTFKVGYQHFDIDDLTEDELDILAKEYGFAVPLDQKLKDLIKNPFYLDEYLRIYDSIKQDITYSDFKDVIWNKKISGQITKDGINIIRQEQFISLARSRADNGNFYVKSSGLDIKGLNELVKDEILGFNEQVGGFFITHDIYEEWALDKVVDRAFAERTNFESFYLSLGDSLPIRRAYRHWLYSKLVSDEKLVQELIKETIASTVIESHWRDEALVSVMLSDHADKFLAPFPELLLADDAALLVRATYLLRIACKEIDDSLLRRLGLQRTKGLALTTLMTRPRGTGWQYIINFIFKNKEVLGLKHYYSFLGLFTDWTAKNRTGLTTREAGLTALFYYHEASKHSALSYDGKDFEKRIIKVILESANELKSELTEIANEIIAKKQTGHRDKYTALVETMLSSVIDGMEVSEAIPKQVLLLADLFWVEDETKESYGGHVGVEKYFGLNENHFDFFPSSSLRTPIFTLLQSAPAETIEFILSFTNAAVERYVKSSIGKEAEEIEVFVEDNEPIKQCISNRLWMAYRGMQASTSLLESIHMALERWLLNLAISAPAGVIEGVCLKLLKGSHSASITAVVSSVVLAHPSKLFDVAKVLFRTKELFLYDTNRYQADLSMKAQLTSLGQMGSLPKNEIYERERLDAADNKHRKMSLEHQAFSYQFQFAKEDEKSLRARQEVMWKIFDDHYSRLQDKTSESDSDRTWRLFVGRMDIRKMDLKQEERDGQNVIGFVPQLDPELKKFSDESLKQTAEATKHTKLMIWAQTRWDNEESKFKQYPEYEQSPQKVVTEVQQIIDELKNKESDRDFFDRATPAFACSVLMRDFSEALQPEQKEFCCEIVINYASIPFNFTYEYQYGDGIGAAVRALPSLVGISDELDKAVHTLLFAHLFLESQLTDQAISAIIIDLWELRPEYAHSLFIGYLLLAPKYDQVWDELRVESHKKGVYDISKKDIWDAFEGRYENDIERVIENKVTYGELSNLEKADLHTLKTAFELIPSQSTNADHHQFIKFIVPIFASKLSNDRNDRVDYRLRYRFFQKFAHFLLFLKPADIKDYLDPLLTNFTHTFHGMRYMSELINEFVSVEDRVHRYEQFWTIWNLLYPSIESVVKKWPDYHDTKSILRSYLFAGTSWKEGAKEWASFKEKDESFFRDVANNLGFHSIVLYSLARLLNKIGSNYIEAGIGWLSDILSKNKNLLSTELEVNTDYYLENAIRSYVLANKHKVKTTPSLKKAVLTILNFLIEKGSLSAYITREDIL